MKDGEAEWYRGVTLKFVHGKTAILTIKEDGVFKEEVVLHKISTKAAMHQMMLEKGFVKKTDEEIEGQNLQRKAQSTSDQKTIKLSRAERMKQTNELKALAAQEKKERRERELLRKREEREILGPSAPSYSSMFQIYFGLISVSVVYASFTAVRRRRRRR